MSEENIDNQEETKDKLTLSKEELDALIQQRLDENLKEVKAKLDNAYQKRDSVLKENEELKKEKRDAELKRLQEEGKHKEAYEMQIEELKRQNEDERLRREQIEKRNDELARDMEIRQLLTLQPFKNKKALDLAYLEVLKDVVKNENGIWVSKTGGSIESLIESFVKDEENAFLLKSQTSSGSGSSGAKTTVPTSKKSLFEMSQTEVLKMVQEGKINR